MIIKFNFVDNLVDMNNLLKLILSLAVLLFLYLGIVTMYKSCGDDTDRDESGLVIDGDEEEFDIFDDGDESGEILPADEPADRQNSQADEQTIDYTGIDDEIEKPLTQEEIKELVKKKTPVVKEENPQTITKTPSPRPEKKESRRVVSGGSKYMVVAGSYLVRDNAERAVSRLKAKGYSQAEIVQFDGNKYHTVCAYRSDDYDMASSKSTALKRSGIDSYVHTRQ